jgi:hypothetical protein
MNRLLRMTAGRASFWLTLLVIILALDCSLGPSIATAKQPRVPLVSPANVLSDISNKRKQQPSLASKELALYANQLLEEKGFDYLFDICDIVKRPNRIPSPSTAVRPFTLTRADGGRFTLKFILGSPLDALCGDCSASRIPSVQVTRKEMVVIAEGKRYRLRRPAAFVLDEAELVDKTMKKVQRRWQLPYQTAPAGISPDGTKLYLDFYTEYELEGLVLELSENGSIEFKAGADVQLSKGTWLEDHPKDARNAYLSFIRFSAGDKSYIVRFSAPCT